MPDWIGQTVGKVRIEKFLARGGMAEVYLGTHLTLERPVAVKVMHSYIEESPELQTRFQREARVVAGLRHPNIVQIYDFDTHEGHPYIVMEFLRGTSLAAYLRHLHEKKEVLPHVKIGRLLGSLASGLEYAHTQGVVHRDIKPANILLHSKVGDFTVERPLSKNIEPIITDFGLVRIVHSATQTASGMVSGTPAYMSPEQAQGVKVDHRTDIYSLGVVLYEMLAGRVPFEGDSTMAVIYKHINEPPPPIDDIPEQIQAVITKALAKDPNDRYQNVRDLAADFMDAIGMQAEAETYLPARSSTPKPATVIKQQQPARKSLWVGAVVIACACVSIFALGAAGISAASFLPRLTAQASPTTPSIQHTEATHPTNDVIPVTGDEPVGVLRFQSGAALMDQVTVSASLDLPPENTQYEVWLINDERESRRSIGVLTQNEARQFTLTFVDPQNGNLLADANRMEITIEPKPDDSPNSSRNVAYSSSLPSGSLGHIRHLMVATDETPNQIAVSVGLIETIELINQSTKSMSEAYAAGDRAGMRSHAEAVINLIVGKDDPQLYLDWDGNGTISDPGDGYGLLINGEQAGYLDGMIHHASYSADATGATNLIRIHAGHVEICIQNLETWSPELRDIAIRIARSTDEQNIEADLAQASALADQLMNGIDINGNESIDPITGEGGALTAVQHAEYMSDMSILPGENRIPE
ncbi:MAG: protein kinase [Chloroflexi bacterium]|nr:protein kinase [Chloroflexota bacterium]